MKGLARLGALWNTIQSWLFPALEDELGELDEKHRLFVAVCETCAPGARMGAYEWLGNGCPPKSRLSLFKAFVAKALWDFPTTSALLDAVRSRPALRRLCGWEALSEVPSEATFSRAFGAFAEDGLIQSVHEAMIRDRYADKAAGHVSRDPAQRDRGPREVRQEEAGKSRRGGRGRAGADAPPAPTGAEPRGKPRRPAPRVRLGQEEGQQGQDRAMARLQAPRGRH